MTPENTPRKEPYFLVREPSSTSKEITDPFDLLVQAYQDVFNRIVYAERDRDASQFANQGLEIADPILEWRSEDFPDESIPIPPELLPFLAEAFPVVSTPILSRVALGKHGATLEVHRPPKDPNTRGRIVHVDLASRQFAYSRDGEFLFPQINPDLWSNPRATPFTRRVTPDHLGGIFALTGTLRGFVSHDTISAARPSLMSEAA